MANPRMHGIFKALLKEAIPATVLSAKAIPEKQGIHVHEDTVSDVLPSVSALRQKKGQIAVDIFEEGGYFIIKAPIAGVKLSDLDIDVAENTVTIRGRRDQTDQIGSEQYLLQECYWGDFERKVSLPCSVNPTKVRATFSKDNILKVFVPKDESKKVRIVKINEGG